MTNVSNTNKRLSSGSLKYFDSIQEHQKTKNTKTESNQKHKNFIKIKRIDCLSANLDKSSRILRNFQKTNVFINLDNAT